MGQRGQQATVLRVQNLERDHATQLVEEILAEREREREVAAEEGPDGQVGVRSGGQFFALEP